jgi:hypothetical protein
MKNGENKRTKTMKPDEHERKKQEQMTKKSEKTMKHDEQERKNNEK